MLHKIGYIKEYEDSTIEVWNYEKRFCIKFNKICKSVDFQRKDKRQFLGLKFHRISIDIQELQAINKKVQELRLERINIMEDEIKVGEVWKDIRGFPNYQISNLGRIRSIPRPKTKGGILKNQISNTGYVYVSLSKDNKTYRKSVHRLVMNNFYEVNHKDGNKQNNSIDNLEFVTRSENILHRFRILKQKPYKKYEDMDYSTKEGRNKYARQYYQKNKKKILDYGRQWRKKRNEQFKSIEYTIHEREEKENE